MEDLYTKCEAGSNDPLVSYGAQSCRDSSTLRDDDDALLPSRSADAH